MSSLEDNRECLSTALPVWQEDMSRCPFRVWAAGFPSSASRTHKCNHGACLSAGSRGVDWAYSGAPQTRLGGPGGCSSWVWTLPQDQECHRRGLPGGPQTPEGTTAVETSEVTVSTCWTPPPSGHTSVRVPAPRPLNTLAGSERSGHFEKPWFVCSILR